MAKRNLKGAPAIARSRSNWRAGGSCSRRRLDDKARRMDTGRHPPSSHPHLPASLLTSLLRDVSRSFYLTSGCCPRDPPQIGLDLPAGAHDGHDRGHGSCAAAGRLQALDTLRRGFSRQRAPPGFWRACPPAGHPGGACLAGRVEEALAALVSFSSEDQARIRAVLDIITSGQELDLRRFCGPSQPHGGLETDADLDDLRLSRGRLRRRFLDEDVPRAPVPFRAARPTPSW